MVSGACVPSRGDGRSPLGLSSDVPNCLFCLYYFLATHNNEKNSVKRTMATSIEEPFVRPRPLNAFMCVSA